MQTFQFQFSDSGELESMELSDLPAARRPALALASGRLAAESSEFWDGRSVAVSVSIGGAPPLFSILIATIHGGLFGTH
jgi:hypothetical protein